MAKTIRNDRGIALLLVISVTTILIATALEYNRRARFAVISAAAARDRLTLSHMASSGIHAAMALLAKDRAESYFPTAGISTIPSASSWSGILTFSRMPVKKRRKTASHRQLSIH